MGRSGTTAEDSDGEGPAKVCDDWKCLVPETVKPVGLGVRKAGT